MLSIFIILAQNSFSSIVSTMMGTYQYPNQLPDTSDTRHALSPIPIRSLLFSPPSGPRNVTMFLLLRHQRPASPTDALCYMQQYSSKTSYTNLLLYLHLAEGVVWACFSRWGGVSCQAIPSHVDIASCRVPCTAGVQLSM